MHKLEKGDNSARYIQSFAKSLSGHLHLGHNLCAKYNDPSSSHSPDILLTRFHRFTMHKSKKGHNSVNYSQNFMKKLIRSSASWTQKVCLIS